MQRNRRLRRPEQFGRVRRDGKTWSHPLLILNAARNRVGRVRCGFVVGKQVGKAHDRNRAKRRVREAVRLRYGHIAPGWDLVLVVRPAVLRVPFAEISDAVEVLLRRAGIWQAPETAEEISDGSSAGTGDDSRISVHLAHDTA